MRRTERVGPPPIRPGRIFAKLDLEADQATHRRVLAVLAYLHGASLYATA